MTISKRRLLFAATVQRTTNERLARRVMFGTMAGGENPRPSRPKKNWAQCLADDLRVYKPPRGSRKAPVCLLFGVETVLQPRASKKSGKWYRGVAAADCFTARWHRDGAPKSRLRHAAEDAKSGDKGWGGGAGGSRTDTAFDECRRKRYTGWIGIGSTSP